MRKISILVGHSRKSPGAVSCAPFYLSEYEYNMGFAQYLSAKLSERFEVVIFFRDNQKLSEAYEEVRKFNPDLNIELHFNSTENQMARGTEVLYSKPGAGYAAETLQDALCKALNRMGSENRGVKFLKPGDRGYSNTQYLDCPNVLIEPFFGSNAQDFALGQKLQSLMAHEISDGLALYFGVADTEPIDN